MIYNNIIGIMESLDAFITENSLNGKKDCVKCKRWLKRDWRGDTCSKCLFKQRYQAKVLKNIKIKFKDAKENPFDTLDFTDYTPELKVKIAKFVGIYCEDHKDSPEGDEKLTKRLIHFATIYNEPVSN